MSSLVLSFFLKYYNRFCLTNLTIALTIGCQIDGIFLRIVHYCVFTMCGTAAFYCLLLICILETPRTLEFFVLERVKTEVSPSIRQNGGLSGSSTNHYLTDAWNYILECLDDEKGPVVNLVSIDFAKAFNWRNGENYYSS